MYSYSLYFSLSCDERQRFFKDMKWVTSTRERTGTLVRHQSSNSTTHDISVYHYVAGVRVMVCHMSGLSVSQDQNTVLSERLLCLVFSLSVVCRPKCAPFMLIVLLLSLSFSTHPSAWTETSNLNERSNKYRWITSFMPSQLQKPSHHNVKYESIIYVQFK